MKRFLLIATVAVLAMTASAQRLASIDLSNSKVLTKAPKAFAATTENIQAKDFSALRKKLQKAPEQSDIYGTYVEDDFNAIHECSAATFAEYTDPDEGKTYVELKFDEIYVDVLGEYDAETGVITIEPQICYEHETYGKFALYALNEEGRIVKDPLTLTIDEDGVIYLDQAGYITYMTEGDYKGYAWNYKFNVSFTKPNGEQSGSESSSRTGRKWAKTTYPVFIEDYETQVNVYNFCGYSCATIDINDDLSVSIKAGQEMVDLGTDETDAAIYGDYATLLSMYIEGNYIYADYEATEITGTIEGNTITISNPASQGYLTICSKEDEEGGGYRYGNFVSQKITLNDGNFAAGIQEVAPTREDVIKNTKTYNLMGQQVDRSATKGILIRNGKKFVQK